jgi:hypothetical protein
MRGTRKQKPVNNTYVPSPTMVPELNMSYLKNINFNSRRGLNEMILASNLSRNKGLSNAEMKARRNVTMKMARGEPISNAEKLAAGMIAKNVANARKYNNALKSVTAKIQKMRNNLRIHPKMMPKPPYSLAEANILGMPKINELKATIKGGRK